MRTSRILLCILWTNSIIHKSTTRAVRETVLTAHGSQSAARSPRRLPGASVRCGTMETGILEEPGGVNLQGTNQLTGTEASASEGVSTAGPSTAKYVYVYWRLVAPRDRR